MRSALLAIVVALAPALASAEALTADQAVAVALQRNRDVIAARLEIDAAELDRVQAGLYWNPQLSVGVGNLLVGSHNSEGGAVPSSPGFFGQTVTNVSLSEVIDIWAKRSARIRAAERGIEHRRLLTADALREIAYAVRSAWADLLRERSEQALAIETRDRYQQTIKISRARQAAGDISEAELRKIELEGLRYESGVIDAAMEIDLARQKLAGLLALPPSANLDPAPVAEQPPEKLDLAAITRAALDKRPDLGAARAARALAEANLSSARREALPDISLGVGYTHSEFTASGDNPNTMAFSLGLPVPLFDRNQANIGRARLDMRKADNDAARLELEITHEVADVVRRESRAADLLDLFERGGMLERADTALKVAEKSYQAGSLSLLELLEAQRTYIETRAEYLRAQHDYRQASIDLAHAVGGEWH